MDNDFKKVEFPMKDIILACTFDHVYNCEPQHKFFNDVFYNETYYRKVKKMMSGLRDYEYRDNADWIINFGDAFPKLKTPVYDAAVELSLKLKKDFSDFYKSLDKMDYSLQSPAIIKFCEDPKTLEHCETEARKMAIKHGLPSSIEIDYSEKKAMGKAFNHDKTCSYDHLRKPIKPTTFHIIGVERSGR